MNGEMGDFGGILLVRNGTTENLVRDYDADYDRRTHRRQIARALRGWMAFLTEGRDFRLMPDAAWKHRSMPFDAHFDDDFWFYFRSRDEMAALQTPLQVSMDHAAHWGSVEAGANHRVTNVTLARVSTKNERSRPLAF